MARDCRKVHHLCEWHDVSAGWSEVKFECGLGQAQTEIGLFPLRMSGCLQDLNEDGLPEGKNFALEVVSISRSYFMPFLQANARWVNGCNVMVKLDWPIRLSKECGLCLEVMGRLESVDTTPDGKEMKVRICIAKKYRFTTVGGAALRPTFLFPGV